MDMKRQQRAPIYEALEVFKKKRVVPFDVPGHKRGRGNPELVQLLGEKCVELDVNSMKPLDNLCHPISVIREAEELTADAFGAKNAFLMVGGTTSAVQAMILSTCKAGDKDHTAKKRTQERAQCAGAMRCDSGLCKPTDECQTRNFSWNGNRSGAAGDG